MTLAPHYLSHHVTVIVTVTTVVALLYDTISVQYNKNICCTIPTIKYDGTCQSH